MIRRFARRLRDHVNSLYVSLVIVIIFAMLVAIGTYVIARITANYYIDNVYVSDEAREERELDHIKRLQEYIKANKLTSEDIAEISKWSKNNRYVYLMLYKDDQLFFTSDMIIPDEDEENKKPEGGDKNPEGGDENPENPDTGEGMGGSSGGDGTLDGDTSGGDGGSSDGENTPDGGGSGSGDSTQGGTDDPDGEDEPSDGEGTPDSGETPDGGEDSDKENWGETGGNQSGSQGGSQGGNQGGSQGGSQSGNQGGSQGGNQGGSQGGSGITIDYPTRDELMQYAQANDQHVIELSDGMLLASVAEYSEYFYYDISNIFSLVLAMIVLATVIVSYFSRLIARIKRLEADVTIVSRGNMSHKISSRGYDEISRLSENVDDMRNSILENLKREREARDANTELITAMSHDIRTPLTVLLGYLEMMKSETDELPLLAEYVSASEKTAMRLKQLSDDMFKYSLAFGDAAEGITLEEYDAAVLLEQMLAEHLVLLRESGFETVVEYQGEGLPEGATVMTDAQNLMRIVDNVFSNLYKYAEKSEPIYVSMIGERDSLTFVCKNTVAKDISRVESNGIGLKTCSRLAKFLSAGFEYKLEDGSFVARLTLNIQRHHGAKRGEK
ncbi:MAG: HAMP domain-containing histidine kinase [Clostridia bacterium]|nr:HAMP domain-containing histidine kinase [Clostridia bacterium]